jgi:hypothetical protein
LGYPFRPTHRERWAQYTTLRKKEASNMPEGKRIMTGRILEKFQLNLGR